MYKSNLLIIPVFFISLSLFCQNSEGKIYSWYDGQMGIENTKLFRGIEYVETDRMINEKHKFLESQEFQMGSLTYDGQFYQEVLLKYNIYDDLLLVNLKSGLRNSFFQLITEKVNHFQINGKKFRNLKVADNTDFSGFYEVINEEGDFKIFKKHLRNRLEIRDKSIAYSEFSIANPDYIFQFKDEYFQLDSQRDLIFKFPYLRYEIRKFYRDNRKQLRNRSDLFMKNLANVLNIQISTSTNPIKE